MKRLPYIIIVGLILGVICCKPQPRKPFQDAISEDSVTGLNRPQVYILTKHVANSDFNYAKLKSIDDNINGRRDMESLMPIFEPVRGSFHYYQFLASFIGEGHSDGGPRELEEFHDILIIKTDSNNKIIDAYQYTLEWAEPPLQYDLFESTAQDIRLTNGLSLGSLKFERAYLYRDENTKKWNHKGILKLD